MNASASPAVIRQWARDNGLEVGQRGRLSPQLLQAYADSRSKPRVNKKQQPAAAAVASARHLGNLRISARPTPAAIGIARRISARSS